MRILHLALQDFYSTLVGTFLEDNSGVLGVAFQSHRIEFIY